MFLLLFNALTYRSILHLRTSCCLLVYPWGWPSHSAAVVPHREESPVDNSCWLKETNQGSTVCTCGYNCGRLKEAKSFKKIPKHFPQPGLNGLSPCIIGLLTNQGRVFRVLEMPHWLELLFSPPGSCWLFWTLSLLTGTVNCVPWTL